MLIRRLGVLVISMILGALITIGIITFLGTTAAEYGAVYFIMTALAFGLAIAIWIDKFVGTEMLPK